MRVPMMMLLKEPGHSEHISMEGDPEASATTRQPYRKTIVRYSVTSKLCGYSSELSILDGHYLAVRSIGPNKKPRKYQFDLRFIHSKPIRRRRIAWSWLCIGSALSIFGITAIATSRMGDLYTQMGLISSVVSLPLGVGALLLFLRRTTESLEFRSIHGDAILLSVTGGFGSVRKSKQFFVELIKHIYAATRVRSVPKQQFLSNEMREHFRLRELGILTEQEYERSKARILAAH